MEKPIVVYSAWHNKSRNVMDEQIDLAYYSNYLAQKQGFRTVLYTDQESKNLLKHIPYDEVIDFDEDLLDKLPVTMWAAGKILAMSLEKRPFLHVDFDFMIYSPKLLEWVQGEDFTFFHYEPWFGYLGRIQNNFSSYRYGYLKLHKIIKNQLNINIDEEEFMSHNFSIFGSCKQHVIKIINKECKNIINLMIDKKKELENPYLSKYFNKFFGEVGHAIISVLIEQVILPLILIKNYKLKPYSIITKSLNTNIPDINQEAYKKGLIHLWGAKTNKKIMNQIRKKVFSIQKN